jgi:putative ABC transport system ATP-binding protein
VMELLQNLHREGATICMVTHDRSFAMHAQRDVHLFDGKVVEIEEQRKLMVEVWRDSQVSDLHSKSSSS